MISARPPAEGARGSTGGSVRRQIAKIMSGVPRGTAGTVALNLSTIALNFVTTVVLSRLLGASELGAFAFAVAWSSVLAVPAALGLLPLIIRSVASFSATASWGPLRGLLRRANQAVVAASVVVVILGAAAGWVLTRSEPDLFAPVLLGLSLVPLVALTMVRQGAMQGLGHVVLGRLPETIIAPLLFFVLIGASWAASRNLTASSAVALNVMSFGAAFCCGIVLLSRALPAEARAAAPQYETLAWFKQAMPLLVLNGATVLQGAIGTILLGAMQSPAETGIFNVAVRGALAAGIIATGASYALMPLIASLFATNQLDDMQAILTRSARAVFVLSIPFQFALIAFAHHVLQIFGEEFTAGDTTLRLIVGSELVRVLLGFAAVALVMGGFDRTVSSAAVSGVVVTAILDVLLIPLWGGEGAAVGLGVGVLTSTFITTWALWRRLGVYSPIIGVRNARRIAAGVHDA